MKIALEYISLKKEIKKVTLTDKAVFTHKSDKIPLFILYLFKYGEIKIKNIMIYLKKSCVNS